MKFIAIIPARFASSRFPGKPLAMIDGISMVMRVYGQAKKAASVRDVAVATDDERIFRHVVQQGGTAIMTSADHASGTDRVNEAAIKLIGEKDPNDFVVINIQGDEPFIRPEAIDSLTTCFEQPGTEIATLMKKIGSDEELFDENVVKVIPGKDLRALYFSRTALPFIRGREKNDWRAGFTFYKHLGIYAYTADALHRITSLKPSALELAESLEQLRWLENGFSIQLKETDYESISVDRPDDLLKFTNRP